ncbi:hypothetical protein SEA_RENNA12_28 [Arthrobacter phage Renna12]|nr:hypothetical protein SEA_RENNA12_28 [Arthrobacter phage Renna12]
MNMEWPDVPKPRRLSRDEIARQLADVAAHPECWLLPEARP